jgi:hypothetical protein
MKALTKTANAIGDGLVAGFLGTAAMTVSSTLEARLRHRQASTAPARATAKALGITAFDSDLAQARFNDLSHWGYGTGWAWCAASSAPAACDRRRRPPPTARRCGAARRSPFPPSTSPRRSCSGAARRSP